MCQYCEPRFDTICDDIPAMEDTEQKTEIYICYPDEIDRRKEAPEIPDTFINIEVNDILTVSFVIEFCPKCGKKMKEDKPE